MTFKGKNVVVTGANRGLGRAAVEAFAAVGANVWACARKVSDEFEADMKALAERYGVLIEPVYFDLTEASGVKAGIMQIVAAKRSVDILVNNAGIPYGGLMMTTPIDKLREVFEVNYFSQIRMMQMVGKLMMRQKSGAIVNVASVGGIETTPGYLAYGSSKAALIWATKTVAKELAPFGIRVNAVAPGLTKTDMGGYKSSEELEKTIARTAMRRMAEPREVVSAILYLSSDDASFVTGTVLQVDGGRI